MKRVLAIILAMTLVLSLCACSGGDSKKGGDASSGSQISDNQSLTNTTPVESAEPDTPKRVTGDRVPLNGEEVGPKYMPTDWVPGPVDPEDLFVKERMPIDENNFRLSASGETEDGGIIKFMVATKNENIVFEIETGLKSNSMMTRFFEQDGETYMYVKGTEEGEAFDQLYRLVNTEVEPSNGQELDGDDPDSTEPVEIEQNEPDDTETTEPVDDSYEGGVAEITESFGIDEMTGGLNADGMSPENYKSVEYVDLIGGNDTFKAITKKDEEQLLLIDHTTGWIVGLNQVSGGEAAQKMAVRLEYDVTDDLTYDVSGTVDMNSDEAMMMLLAQFFLLIDFSDISMD